MDSIVFSRQVNPLVLNTPLFRVYWEWPAKLQKMRDVDKLKIMNYRVSNKGIGTWYWLFISNDYPFYSRTLLFVPSFSSLPGSQCESAFSQMIKTQNIVQCDAIAFSYWPHERHDKYIFMTPGQVVTANCQPATNQSGLFFLCTDWFCKSASISLISSWRVWKYMFLLSLTDGAS